MTDQGNPGTRYLDSHNSDFHAIQYMIEQAIGQMSKVQLVQITKVTATGAVAGVGKVSVSPLVKMQDALGNQHAHGAVNNLTYFRMQGGKDKAIIMDPKVGDVGIAIFADRDISAAKKNLQGWDGTKTASQAQSPAGSFRHHDMADGIFFGCTLGGTPTSYIQFGDDGSIIISPDAGVTVVTVKGNLVKVTISGVVLIAFSPNRVDLGCDVNQGTSNVLTVGGPLPKVWGKP